MNGVESRKWLHARYLLYVVTSRTKSFRAVQPIVTLFELYLRQRLSQLHACEGERKKDLDRFSFVIGEVSCNTHTVDSAETVSRFDKLLWNMSRKPLEFVSIRKVVLNLRSVDVCVYKHESGIGGSPRKQLP